MKEEEKKEEHNKRLILFIGIIKRIIRINYLYYIWEIIGVIFYIEKEE